MRRLAEHSGAPGHIYPLALLCNDIMPPPPQVCPCFSLGVFSFFIVFLSCDDINFFQVEKEIGEERVICFHGVGVSVAPGISFSEIATACGNPEEVGSI